MAGCQYWKAVYDASQEIAAPASIDISARCFQNDEGLFALLHIARIVFEGQMANDATACDIEDFHTRLRDSATSRSFWRRLISDVLPFSPLWYAGPNAISNAIRYAKSSSRSHDAVIRVFDGAGNVIETHEQAGDLLKPRTFASASPATPSSVPAKSASADIATTAPALGGGHDLVWVNTEKHVYHREDSRFYGTTKKGKYMTEREAIQTGNKAARLGRVAAQSNAIGYVRFFQPFTRRRHSRLR